MKEQATNRVLIAGGGPVGATLALALAQNGVPVTLAEAAPLDAPPTDGRAYAFSLTSRVIMRTLGLWEALEGCAQPIGDILVTDGRVGEAPSALRLHFDHREGTEGPCGHMVEDRVLRPSLAAALLQAPNVECLAPVGVTQVTADTGCATATLADGRTLRVALVLACDGARSAFARQAGIGHVGWRYGQDAIVATVSHERPHRGWAYEHFLPAGPFAILPLAGDRASIVWTERPAFADALEAQGIEAVKSALFARIGGFLGALSLEGGTRRFPLALRFADRLFAPRLALVGDAAHQIHPIAGQGLNLGMRGAAALAEVLIEAKRRGEDLGASSVLARYQRWHRPSMVAMALATDGLNRLFSNDIPPLRLMRDAGMALIGRIGPARRFFQRQAAGLGGQIPRLALGDAL